MLTWLYQRRPVDDEYSRMFVSRDNTILAVPVPIYFQNILYISLSMVHVPQGGTMFCLKK